MLVRLSLCKRESFFYVLQVGSRIAGEADLVSSAVSLHPQRISNCGFVLYQYSESRLCLCAFFAYAETIKLLLATRKNNN